MFKTRNKFALVAVLASVCLIGCGKGGPGTIAVVPVKGTVYLDGKAHGPGTLTLTPVRSVNNETRSTVGGEIAADGSFTLTTHKQGDGAPPGEYTVSLGSAGGDASSTDPAKMMSAFTGSPTQPLKITIPSEGSSSLEIRLKSRKNTRKGPANAPVGIPSN